MSSGWEAYYIFVLAGAVAILFPLGLRLLSLIFEQERVPQAEIRTVTSQIAQEARINVRYFVPLLLGFLLVILSLLLIPIVAVFSERAKRGDFESTMSVWVAVATICIFLSLGLLYASKKGDFTWLRSHRDESDFDSDSSKEDSTRAV